MDEPVGAPRDGIEGCLATPLHLGSFLVALAFGLLAASYLYDLLAIYLTGAEWRHLLLLFGLFGASAYVAHRVNRWYERGVRNVASPPGAGAERDATEAARGVMLRREII